MDSISSVSTYNQIARSSGNNSAITSASACGVDYTESNALTWLTASEICLCCVARRRTSWMSWLTMLSAHSWRPPIKNKSVKREMFVLSKKKKKSHSCVRKVQHCWRWQGKEATTQSKLHSFISVTCTQANMNRSHSMTTNNVPTRANDSHRASER